MHRDPVIVIGSGLAGYGVVRELRRLDSELPVSMLSADHAGFYSKPMLSNALTTGKTPETLLNSDAVKMADQQKITISPYTRVTGIDRDNHVLTLQDGDALPYGRLVLALGADQIHLPLQGDGVSDILSINDLDDYRRFRHALEGKKQISIIGAGLIGCEFANDLAAAGYQVNVIDISPQPLGRLLPPAAGAYLKKKLAGIGVDFYFDATTQQVERAGERLRLVLASGKALESDIILSAVGLRPRTKLAEAAGLRVSRGIVTNHLLQTQDPEIFALGDCAEVQGKVLPFVMPITHAARALAATLTGNPTPVHYPAMPVLVKTPACPTVVSPPDSDAKGEWHVNVDEDGVRALFKDVADNLLGFALLGASTKEKNALTAQLPPVLQ